MYVYVQFHCCGATNYTDWVDINWNRNSSLEGERLIPESCCATVGGCNAIDGVYFMEEDLTYNGGNATVWTQVHTYSCMHT